MCGALGTKWEVWQVSHLAPMFGFLGFIWVVSAMPISIWWIVGPVDIAARSRRYPRQFNLADFLCLFFLAQVPLACLRGLTILGDENLRRVAILLGVLGVAMSALMWWCGVHILSRAGVRRTWH